MPLQISFLKEYHDQIYCSFKKGAGVLSLQNVWRGPWASAGWLADVLLGDHNLPTTMSATKGCIYLLFFKFSWYGGVILGISLHHCILSVLGVLPWPLSFAFYSCWLPIVDPALSFNTCKWESENWKVMEEQDLSHGDPLLNTGRSWDHFFLFPVGLHS